MKEPIRKRGLLRAAWLLAVMVVVVGSLLPADSSPILALARLDISDRLEHFGAYWALAFLPAIHERWKFILVAALGVVALGVGLEFAQPYSPGRLFEFGDLVADTLGVCSGVAMAVPLRSSGAIRSFLSMPPE